MAFPGEIIVDNERQRDWFVSPVLASMPELINVEIRPSLIGYHKSLRLDLQVRDLSLTTSAKRYLWRYVEFAYPGMPFQDFRVGKAVGRIITISEQDSLGKYIVFAVSNKVVTIVLTAAAEDRDAYERSVRSLKLDGSQLFKSDTDYSEQIQFDLSLQNVESSPEVKAALEKPTIKRQFAPARPVQELSQKQKDTPENKTNYSRPLIILRQPRNFPYLQPNEKFKGVVTARIEFRADGTVGEIVLYGQAPNPLLKRLFEEIAEIKFLPAKSGSKEIDLVQTVEYSFDIR